MNTITKNLAVGVLAAVVGATALTGCGKKATTTTPVTTPTTTYSAPATATSTSPSASPSAKTARPSTGTASSTAKATYCPSTGRWPAGTMTSTGRAVGGQYCTAGSKLA